MNLLLCNKCRYQSSCKFKYIRYTANTIVVGCTSAENNHRKEFLTQSLITPRELDRHDVSLIKAHIKLE